MPATLSEFLDVTDILLINQFRFCYKSQTTFTLSDNAEQIREMEKMTLVLSSISKRNLTPQINSYLVKLVLETIFPLV